jgi:hypothetical protein
MCMCRWPGVLAGSQVWHWPEEACHVLQGGVLVATTTRHVSLLRQHQPHLSIKGKKKIYSQICPNSHLCSAATLFLSLCSTFPIKTISPKRPSVLYGHYFFVPWVTALDRFVCSFLSMLLTCREPVRCPLTFWVVLAKASLHQVQQVCKIVT